MRIVDRKTFLALPPETVFCKYEDGCFGDVGIKHESWDIDFIVCDLIGQFNVKSSDEHFDLLDDAEKTGKDYPFSFDETYRDGMFDEDQLFAIFSPDDIKNLANRLLKTLETNHA